MADDKYSLITKNIHEVIGEDDIKKVLSERNLRVYWGTAATGKPHIGYFVPLLKIIDLLQADCEVTVLIADLHAVLDNLKSTFEQVQYRTEYYTMLIKEIIQSLNTEGKINMNNLKFVRGTDFQLSKEYTLDMYKAQTLLSVSETKHASAEVVKQSNNPKVSGLLYPTLQALDEQYLNVDLQLGGVDQRKIFVHSRTILPKLGYKQRSYILNKMVSGLRSTKQGDEANEIEQKMSSSNLDSKIDFSDTRKQIDKKINKCYCVPGDIKDNCLLELLEHIIFPLLALKGLDFVINRPEKFGGPIVYKNINNVSQDFADNKLHPADFKFGIADNLDTLIKPIRDVLINNTDLIQKAYG